MSSPIERLKCALVEDNIDEFRALLTQHPELKARIDDPVAAFDSPLITQVRSRAMLDVLLDAGADINARSKWWAGGFGLLDSAKPDLAGYAIERGARIDVHSAARLGLLDQLRALLREDPARVHARGGDGQTPLHFAGTIEVAGCLLEHGADLNARDIDHESTPVQYMVPERKEVARYLVQRGCQTDLLLSAVLGDRKLAEQHLAQDPECIRMRVSDEYFPMIGQKNGGTIYQWHLGWYVSAHDLARKFGHDELYRWLLQRSPLDFRLAQACWEGDAATAKALFASHPALVSSLNAADRRLVAHAARNNDLVAFRLLLEGGFPLDARSQHGATALHWAAYHGNAEMVRLILQHRPPLDVRDEDFSGTALGWTIHGSESSWHRATGDYGTVAAQLIQAGWELPEKLQGSSAVQTALRRAGVSAN